MKNHRMNNRPNQEGFTLVETLVAIALFSILITVAVGGFTNALRTQRQIAAFLAAESNISLAIEQMTREIRTGSDFCPSNAQGQSLCDIVSTDAFTGAPVYNNLAFVNAEGQTVVYELQNGILEKSVDGGVTFNPVTGSDTTIDDFSVTIFGNVAGDHWNPRVTLSIGVSPNDPTLTSQVLNLQTTVSARTIDCDATGNC